MNLLTPLLTPFIPLAAQWVEEQEATILKRGRPLTSNQRKDAAKAGVKHPERIRVLWIRAVPFPKGILLGTVAKLVGAGGDDVSGATFGYGIMIPRDCINYRQNRELFLHEFCHVHQVERYGSLEAFLLDYYRECLVDGYGKGRLEKQADRKAAKIVRGG